MSAAGRKRRPLATAVCGLLVILAVLLGVVISLWFLVAVPFALLAGYGTWVGLSNDEIFDALDVGDDPGAGTPGMTP